MLFAIAAVVSMVLMVFQALPLVEAGKKSGTTTAPVTWDSTPNRLQLNWTGEEALINQTRSSYVDSSSPADFRTAQAVSVWDVKYPTQTIAPPNGGAADIYNEVGIDVMSTIDARRQMGYTTYQTTTGGSSILNTMWDQLSATHQLSLGVNGGKWMTMNQPRILYGAFYVDAYVSSNGWVAFRNFTEANKNNPSLWMWGADTNVWNVTLPTSSGTAPAPPLKNAAVIAPLWAQIDYWDPSGGIRAGELSTAANTGFCVVWKYVHIAGTSGWSSFGVRIGLNDWSTEGVNTQNTFRFTYGALGSGLATAKYGAGMEDQIGWHYTVVTPTAEYCRYFDANADSDYAVKQMTVKYEKFVSSDGGANWGPDTTDSWIAPPYLVGTGANPKCEAYMANLALDNPTVKASFANIWEYIAVILWIAAMFLLPVAALTLSSIMEWAVFIGGQVLGLEDVFALFPVYTTDPGVVDRYWIANLTDASQDIKTYGRDYMSGSATNKVHFAWDASMLAHLNWYIKASSVNRLHKLKITTTAWYGDINTGTGNMPWSQTTSNEVVIGSTGLAAGGGKTSWLGRTSPDGHSVKYAPRNVPTSEIPGYSKEYVAYHIETTVSTDVGYAMMAYNGVGTSTLNDPHSRADRTILVEGWFKMSDSLSTTQQIDGRCLWIYVMAPDRNHNGIYEEGNFDAQLAAKVLSYSDSVDTWQFRTVKVWLPYSINTHEPFKIGIGRPISAGYTGTLVAEWAGVQIVGYEKDNEQEGFLDHWALTPYVTKFNTADAVSDMTLPYSNKYDTPQTVTISPVPAKGANGAALSRVGHWAVGGQWIFGQGPITIAMAGADQYFEAQFVAINKFEVYVMPTEFGGTDVSPSGSNAVTSGGNIKITATMAPSSNHVFTYWSDYYGAPLLDDSGVDISTQNPVTFAVTKDRYVQANWWAGGCVAEGTMVTMADQSQLEVQKLKVGDQVLGYDLTTSFFVTETVSWLSCMKADTILDINHGALRVTPGDQPIYVRNASSEGWIANPSEIQIGWEILDLTTHSWVVVYSLEYEHGQTKVYDFQTDGPMTYLANGYLVLDKPHR